MSFFNHCWCDNFLFFKKKIKNFLPVSITNKTAPALVFACVVLLSVRSQLAVNWIPTNLFQTHCFALCLPELESLQRFSAEFLKYICFFSVFAQCAKTFLNLMAHISKEQTVQYILTLIDDTLQVHRQNHWPGTNGICMYKPTIYIYVNKDTEIHALYIEGVNGSQVTLLYPHIDRLVI